MPFELGRQPHLEAKSSRQPAAKGHRLVPGNALPRAVGLGPSWLLRAIVGILRLVRPPLRPGVAVRGFDEGLELRVRDQVSGNPERLDL